jgi:hypothetical protein
LEQFPNFQPGSGTAQTGPRPDPAPLELLLEHVHESLGNSI